MRNSEDLMPTFDELLAQITDLLRRDGRLTYRSLKRRFGLDDDYVADLRDELIKAKRIAIDEDGKVLVWTGATPVSSSKFQVPSSPPQLPAPNTQPPISYTPPHLAERIRAATLTDGERKTITVLFADLKGSTALIEGLDPEDARAIIDPALQLMMDAVHRYEGYVAQALGDGIFALFGAPLAHEDHPQRALYAALRMQEEMRHYSDEIRLKHGVPLAMRVGINTGEVVVRSIRKDDLHTDYVPVGHSTNLAARMEQMATPGSILITDDTRKLVEGYFEFRALGAMQIKGVEEPLHVYEVLGTGPLRTRLQVAAQRGLTRFVGRQSELEQMHLALEHAKAGRGQIVGVMGEPGLGKSRLFYEFKLVSQAGGLILEAYSVSHGKASPYLPVIEILKSYFRIEPQDDERLRRERVIGKVLGLDRSLEDTLPYLFALLGIEEQPSPLQQMDPQIRRRRTFDALKKLFLRESLKQPLILIFEDLHWIDSETQGFLDTLSESVASAKIFLLVNYRPEYRHDWGQKTYYTQLRLAPFGQAEAEEFLDELLGAPVEAQHEVPLQSLKHLILEKTEGTPFFIEEVVQTLVEDSTLTGERGNYTLTQHVATLQLPTTVQGVLAARIDRLASDEKALLQQLAVIGREFPLGLVRHVIAHPEDELYRLLSSLQHKEFLYEQPAFPEVEYLFKHALTQEVAYNSVLIERRKVLHEQTAQAIEYLHHDRLEEHYSELSHHYQRSGNTEKAIEYLQKAGQQAVQHSAHAEAINYFLKALALLNTLSHTLARGHKELTLQIALGASLQITKGFASPEVEEIYSHARELCQRVGETPQLFPVLRGLRLFHTVRGQLEVGREVGEQLINLALHLHDPMLLSEANNALGIPLFWLGKVQEAQTYLEQALKIPTPSSILPSILLPSEVSCQGYLAWISWLLGYPDQAIERAKKTLAIAEKLAHPFISANALTFVAMLGQFCRESRTTQNYADISIATCKEQGFTMFLAWGTLLHGWSLSGQGHTAEGITRMRQGLTDWQATGARFVQPYFFGLLADGYGKANQYEEGLAAVSEALTTVKQDAESMYEAELYRLKGELTLQKGAGSWGLGTGSPSPQAPSLKPQVPSEIEQEAEGYFLKALDITQQQQAKSLELRASVSLARLWQQQGKTTEAHPMLSDVYNWFTEGFDTKDLQEAKVLLEELSQ
jgi:class 3 adenylate cyclase/predicted ATPase